MRSRRRRPSPAACAVPLTSLRLFVASLTRRFSSRASSGTMSSELQMSSQPALCSPADAMPRMPIYPRRRSIAEIFRIQVVSNPSVRSPIITLGSTSFFHVRHENLYVVAVTKNNANAALVFEFCYRLIALSRSYFGKLDEESVKNNFGFFYELLDGEPSSKHWTISAIDCPLTLTAYCPLTPPQRRSTLAIRKFPTLRFSRATSTRNPSRPSRLSAKMLPRLRCRLLAPTAGGEATSSTARTKPLWTW